ncbi:MAG: 4Fe-4S dicluster domain-containing protein [Treponema sp.]|nr:4Fe-4S dicluster domain-containing protein [Candidatus Treponema equifaecale]
MILAMVFLFLILLSTSATIYYLFMYFLPVFKINHSQINESMASNFQLTDTKKEVYPYDLTKIAVVENHLVNKTDDNRRLIYNGEKNCQLFNKIYSSEYKDKKICTGYGDCIKKCPQTAITIKETIEINEQLCNGCGKCIEACPEGLISLEPRKNKQNSEKTQKGFKFWIYCYKLLNKSQ